MHVPHDNKPKHSITPRIGNGDVHFHKNNNDKLLENDLETNKTFDNRNSGLSVG